MFEYIRKILYIFIAKGEQTEKVECRDKEENKEESNEESDEVYPLW